MTGVNQFTPWLFLLLRTGLALILLAVCDWFVASCAVVVRLVVVRLVLRLIALLLPLLRCNHRCRCCLCRCYLCRCNCAGAIGAGAVGYRRCRCRSVGVGTAGVGGCTTAAGRSALEVDFALAGSAFDDGLDGAGVSALVDGTTGRAVSGADCFTSELIGSLGLSSLAMTMAGTTSAARAATAAIGSAFALVAGALVAFALVACVFDESLATAEGPRATMRRASCKQSPIAPHQQSVRRDFSRGNAINIWRSVRKLRKRSQIQGSLGVRGQDLLGLLRSKWNFARQQQPGHATQAIEIGLWCGDLRGQQELGAMKCAAFNCAGNRDANTPLAEPELLAIAAFKVALHNGSRINSTLPAGSITTRSAPCDHALCQPYANSRAQQPRR